MLYCLNPSCSHPENPDNVKNCLGCGHDLSKTSKSFTLRLHYRLVKMLGEGAFGRTYLAQDTDLMGEPRVIKKLIVQSQGAALEKAKELFRREAQQLYDLNHPQIPKLYAYFEEMNSLYLVQEFIPGENLRRECKKHGRFTEEKIITLLRDLVPIFQYIHNKRILHRDVKPENIMRRRSDNKMILIDFGGAKQLGTPNQQTTATMIYTPGYAAIEHMMGQPSPVSDLYSLGATCVRLLTGCFPVIDKTGNTIDELYNVSQAHWLWKENLAKQGIKVSDYLARILDKLLQPFPQNRYQSAEELLAAMNVQPISLSNNRTFLPPPPPPRPELQSVKQVKQFKPILKTFEYFVTTIVEKSRLFGGNKNLKTINEYKSAEYFSIELNNEITIELVSIPPEIFMMGSPENEEARNTSEGPQHEVLIQSFFMGKYPITQAQWEAVMTTNPSYIKGVNRPVENVSWFDCVKFCQKLSEMVGGDFRLPSEAEWEYACRAGSITPFSFGPTINTDLANYNGNESYGLGTKGVYRKQTTEIGSFPANPFGLYDMHGNVWEWCADTWHEDYYGAPSDCNPWDAGDDSTTDMRPRVLRGGSWLYGPSRCRSAAREHASPDDRYRTYGLRIACS